MDLYRKLPLLVAVFSHCLIVAAQENLIFHHFTTEEGLPDDAIGCLLQDKKGFLWIGTSNGLCRYDGSRFTIFKYDPADSNSLSDNAVLCLFQDNNDAIWAGTFAAGLNKYDATINGFSHIKKNLNGKGGISSNAVWFGKQYDDGHIMIANGDMEIFDLKTNTTKAFPLPVNTWTKGASYRVKERFNCNKIFIDRQGKWWLTGSAGFIGYDPSTKNFRLVSKQQNIPHAFNLSGTWDCDADMDGKLWIAGDAGLFEYDPVTGSFTQHYPLKFAANDVKTLFVKTVLCDEDGSVWLGTTDGLFHYFPVSGKYLVYRNNPYHPSSISNNYINCLYRDQQNILWVGTSNGLNAVYPGTTPFAVYKNVPGDNNSLKCNLTGGTFKDGKGNMWIGSQSGLEVLDHATGRFDIYTYSDKRLNGQTEYNVLPVVKNDTSTFWAGTWGAGMQLFNYRTRKFEASYVHVPDDSSTLCSNYITSICKDSKGNLWVSTWNGGIDMFDTRTNKFKHFNAADANSGLPSNYISTICYSNNTIWAGCSKGLLRYDSTAGTFIFSRITSDTLDILSATIHKIVDGIDNCLWIGTPKGVLKYDCRKNLIEPIKDYGSFSVASIFPENKQSIWLATNEGLKLYNPGNSEIISYTQKDGLPGRNFPSLCYFSQSPDGEIFVNSFNGLIHFYPKLITRNAKAPPIYFTSIKIKNQQLSGIGAPANLQTIHLKYDQNYVSIGFAALNFINPGANKYAYQLSRIDRDWVYSDTRNEAVYTNLEPGDYVFKVKASNNSGIWNNEGISLTIHISTPWWQAWWFYLSCAVSAAAALYAVYHVRINRLKEMYQMRSNIARDLHDEIGSTLTSINILSKISGQHIEKDQHKAKVMIDEIGDQSQQIQQSMSDIVWAINPENDKLENLVMRIREFIAHTLEPKDINIHFEFDEAIAGESLSMQQRRDLLLIFKEAVNNVAKYALCKNVAISLVRQNGNIELTIADDGTGFDITKNTSSSGIKNMKARAAALNAVIKIGSTPEKGTVINLKIPLH